MSSDLSIKLFLAYHKATPVLSTYPFVPIQGGRAVAKNKLDMIGDDTGDHISGKNPNYCELTVQYWIWKNVKADYVGLAHYRRIPAFRNCRTKKFFDFSEETCRKFGWTKDRIEELCRQYDVIMPPNWTIFPPGEPGNVMTPYEFHRSEHIESDLQTTMQVIDELYPEFHDLTEQVLMKETKACFGNICLMKKDLFDAYSDWLFRILFEVEKRIPISPDPEQARVFGFLSERLINVYLRFWEREGKKIYYCNNIPMGVFEDPRRDSCVLGGLAQKPSAPKMTVIIPVYNTAPYLYRCLNSVINQRLRELEILVVNDGSTDNSLQILEEFAGKDARIKIINQKNQGPSVARNTGLECATGEYVTFLDSDDWFDPIMCYNMYRKALREKSDIVMCTLTCIDSQTGQEVPDPYCNEIFLPQKYFRQAFSVKDILPDFLSLPVFACSKVYRRAFLEQHRLRFIPHTFMEDNPFFFESFLHAERISALYARFYYYRINRSASTMSSKDERFFDHIRIFEYDDALLRNSEHWDGIKELFFNSKLRLINLIHEQLIPQCKKDFFYLAQAYLRKDDLQNYDKDKLQKEYLQAFELITADKYDEYIIFCKRLFTPLPPRPLSGHIYWACVKIMKTLLLPFPGLSAPLKKLHHKLLAVKRKNMM
mgnify:CR=1 FL=1